MKTIQQLWLYTLLLLLSVNVQAQEERDNRGDKYYKDLGYGSAIPEYKSTVGEEGRLDRKTMIRLANSYRLIGDYQNAELYYAQIVESSSKPLYRLYYAQALQANGKCKLAKKYFLEYDQLLQADMAEGSGASEDRRGRILANACDTEFSTNEDLVLQNEAALNTGSLDFSPAFYKNGIVFVSTRGLSRATQNEDAWLNDKFMDLFYAEAQGAERTRLSAPKALTNTINSKFHEGPLTFDQSGNTMYFTRNNYTKGRRGFGKKKVTRLKIYGADWDGEEWGNVWELPFNSDDESHCHPTLSADGRYMYLSSDRAGGYGGHDLYVSAFENGEWSTPVNLGASVNTAGNELFPFMHEDGTLYFASNGHAGLGGLDVFMAKPDAAIAEDNAAILWSTPINLGEPLNSLKDDFGLIVDITGRSGYISSSRSGGLGGDDIYSFKGTLDGAPPKEKAMTTGLITSTTLPTGSLMIGGTVINKLYNKAVPNATVYLTNKCTGETAAKLTDINGGFAFKGECGCEYTLKGEKAGIGTATAYPSTLNVDCSQDIQTRLLIGGEVLSSTSASPSSTTIIASTPVPAPAPTRIISRTPVVTTPAPTTVYRPATTTFSSSTTTYTVGDVIELEHIYYDFDKANIRSDASVDLDKLADVLRRYPGMSIELSSHTDSRATDVYNQALSQRRAQAAVNYLVARGIAPQRLTARGYGESQLRNTCADGTPCSEAEHQRNRRTEFRVLTTDGNVDVRYIDNEPEYIDMPGN